MTEMTKSLNSVNEIADILINGIADDVIDADTVNDLVNGDDDTPTVNTEKQDQVEAEEGESQEEGEEEQAVEDEPMTWGKALGVDESKLVIDQEGNLKGINITINGETQPVDMNTLIDGFQFNSRNAKVSQQLSEEKRQFDTIRNTASEAYTNKLKEANYISEYLNNKLNSEYQNVDWQTLRMRDPAEYAARMQDFNIKNQEIQQLRAAISHELENEKVQQSQQFDQQQQLYLQNQIKLMIDKNPEWSDSSKMQTAFSELSNFVSNTYGISPQEFDSIQNASYIEVLKDAMAYRKGQQLAGNKIAKQVPKFVKNTGPTAPKMSKLDILTKAAKSATGQSARQLKRAAIAEILMNR